MDLRLKYVTRRRDKAGDRWYWQRRGHPLVRLPDDEADRAAMALRLNADADRSAGALAVPGSIGWVIETYQASDDFRDLAPGTAHYYRKWLADIGRLGLAIPFKLLTRRRVVDYISAIEGRGERRKAAAVLRNLFNVAMYHELVRENHAARLKLRAPPRRQELWSPEDIEAWLSAAATHPHGQDMVTAFTLLRYIAQRPADVLKLTWSQHLGDRIRLRQQKTGKLVEPPLHRNLRRHLEAIRPAQTEGRRIVANRGRPIPYASFSARFHQIATAAGVGHLQPRDLRRTAMVNMAEAGATPIEIAAISGHTIEETTKILETYIPRTFAMGQNAIDKLERHEAKRRKKSNAASGNG
ncbi:MAG: tyrosine-type recombinase/integrase [Alphaproteobacteria bacterium]|nr:tyrosine-type recombinase/integrase [Alphaproteobacteria bacterium]